jgi:hypothetical protein
VGAHALFVAQRRMDRDARRRAVSQEQPRDLRVGFIEERRV